MHPCYPVLCPDVNDEVYCSKSNRVRRIELYNASWSFTLYVATPLLTVKALTKILL
jgi:hypothetical protein